MAKHRKTLGLGALAAPTLGVALGLAASSVSAVSGDAATHHVSRPHAAATQHVARSRLSGSGKDGAVTNWSSGLSNNDTGWCTYGASATYGQCNGAANGYGTIDYGFLPHFTNYGGYAAQAANPPGQTGYGRVTGVGDTATGCPTPGSENCTGPFFLAGGANYPENVFPKYGFTTSAKLYIDPVWAAANIGQVVDWDVALNASSPTDVGSANYFEDFAFNLCSTADNGGGFYVSTSNGAGGCSTGPTELSTAGWYTFEHDFYWSSSASELWVSFTILNPSGTEIYQTTEAVDYNPYTVSHNLYETQLGGPDYGWLPDEDVLGLPIADTSVKVNTALTPVPPAPAS